MAKTMASADAQRWLSLAGAAIAARDELRSLAAELESAMSSGRIPRALIIRMRDTAVRHADGLRLALKHPNGSSERSQGGRL